MSDDFVTGLRGDLVEAMARYESRRPVARAATAVRGRRLPALRLAAVAAAAAVAVVFGVQHLPQPQQTPARLSTIATVSGIPVDVLAGDETLWIATFDGRLTTLDLRSGRRLGAVALPFSPQGMVAADGAIWVRGTNAHGSAGEFFTPLVRIDPQTGRVVRRVTSRGGGAALAATRGALWMAVMTDSTREDAVDRLDARTGARTATVSVPAIDGVETGPDAVWAISSDGTVVRIDPRDAEVSRRWPKLAPRRDATSFADRELAPEAGGAWVLSTDRNEIVHIRGDRVVRVIGVGARTRAVLGSADGAVWVASGDNVGGNNDLIRIDERSGEVTQTIDLGDRQPTAIAATADGLRVVTALGEVLRVGS